MSMLRRLVTIAVVVAVAAFLVGMVVGQRSSYGTTHLKTVEAKAKLESKETGLGMADSLDDDHQFAFNVHDIYWTDGSQDGDGDPPCLRKPKKYANVEIGYVELKVPDGPTYKDVALWIRCP